ncbi:CapA family protein [Mesorhizobium sp. M0959]|uniref:CapA family protein n=1 Tax=Mesorhizobium sp. M0959 TaxID=2957034 RepID=UPI0033396CDE
MEQHSNEIGSHLGRQGENYDTVGSIATNVADGFTIVAVGDLILSRPLTKYQHPGFDDIVKILREADVTFGNMESLIFDIRSFQGSPQAEHGGCYHVSLPELGPDLKAMGFNLMSRANNHTLDWGLEGMRETSRILDESGIIHAGVGENLAQAGAARFLETSRGRVALLSFATSFTPMSRACDPAGEAPGRPGLNALRLEKSIVVPPEMLENLRQVRDALPDSEPGREDPNRVVFAGVTYKAGDKAAYSYEPDPGDVADIRTKCSPGQAVLRFLHRHQPRSRA